MARIRPRTEIRSGPSSVSGSGVAPVIGSGSPIMQPSGALGSGFRELPGSGVLVPSSSTVVGSQSVVIPGAFHIDPVGGNDANNGILVGETGTGTTLNGVAGTGAKQTIASVFADMESGVYAQGDLFYLASTGPHLTGQYRYLNGAGSVKAWSQATFDADPLAYDPDVIEFRNLPGEEPTLSTAGASPSHESGSGYGVLIVKGNVRFSGLLLECGNSIFFFGGIGVLTGSSAGAHIYRCRQAATFPSSTHPYGNQKGVFSWERPSSDGVTVQESYLIGHRSTSTNDCTMYFDRPGINNLILDTYISDNLDGQLGSPLHFKYAGPARSLDDWMFRRCMIDTFRATQAVKQADGFSGTTFRHAIIWLRGDSSFGLGDVGNTGSQSSGPEGYQLRFYNSGLYRADHLANRNYIWVQQEVAPDGTLWEMFRNVIAGRVRMETQAGAAYAEGFVGDENVWDVASSQTHVRGPSTLTLAQWQANQAGQGAGNDDALSVVDDIVFASPGTQDPLDPATMQLDSGMALFGTAGPDLSAWRRWAGAGEGSWL